MSIFLRSVVTILLFVFVSPVPLVAGSKIDWEITNAVQLDETPIDVAHSQNRELTFVLTDKAKILIYSAEGKQIGVIPVDPSVTDIALSAKGDQLYFINSKRMTLQTVTLDFIVEFNVADSPFIGPAGAKVAVAVFSDFQ